MKLWLWMKKKMLEEGGDASLYRLLPLAVGPLFVLIHLFPTRYDVTPFRGSKPSRHAKSHDINSLISRNQPPHQCHHARISKYPALILLRLPSAGSMQSFERGRSRSAQISRPNPPINQSDRTLCPIQVRSASLRNMWGVP